MEIHRQNESDDKQRLRQEKDKMRKKYKRQNETEYEQKSRQEKSQKKMKFLRQNETNKKIKERQQKDKGAKRYIRENSTDLQRFRKFRESVKYGPIFTCSICDQDMFKNNVSVLTEEFEHDILAKDEVLHKNTLYIFALLVKSMLRKGIFHLWQDQMA